MREVLGGVYITREVKDGGFFMCGIGNRFWVMLSLFLMSWNMVIVVI